MNVPLQSTSNTFEKHVIPYMNFRELRAHVKQWQKKLTKYQGASQHTFVIKKFSESQYRLYCLGQPDSSCREHTLLFVDITSQLVDTIFARPLIQHKLSATDKQLSREEALLRERQRCMAEGITSFQYLPESRRFLFSTGAGLFNFTDSFPALLETNELESLITEVTTNNGAGAAMDAKMCPYFPDLIAFIIDKDIHLSLRNICKQCTFSADFGGEHRELISGTPSFVIQEEFDRYSGMWWQPKRCEPNNGSIYLLFEETDESNVPELLIGCPPTLCSEIERMRYPRSGENNAKSTLKLLQIDLEFAIDGKKINDFNVKIMRLAQPLQVMFPWAEYFVRVSWHPDGDAVLVQLMSRLQDRLALVYIPLNFFVYDDFDKRKRASFGNNKNHMSATALISRNDSSASMDDISVQFVTCPLSILYEEFQPDGWINFHDHLHVFQSTTATVSSNISQTYPTSQKVVKFLYSSEKSGFRHLYLITALLSPVQLNEHDIPIAEGIYGPMLLQELTLTIGDWEVLGKSEIHVDEQHSLIYFLSTQWSPIEAHLFVTSYLESCSRNVFQLTIPGHSFAQQRNPKPFVISSDGQWLVCICSSLIQPPKLLVYQLLELLDTKLPRADFRFEILTPEPLSQKNADATVDANIAASDTGKVDGDFSNNDIGLGSILPHQPEIVKYRSSLSGVDHYAVVFLPWGWCSDRLYPVILAIYGGPDVQMVRNEWMGRAGFQKYCQLGYAVVAIDGRGSFHRGVAFESHIRHRMGQVEIADQIEGFQHVAAKMGIFDMSRVCIRGWSYGGYMALMALVQHPDIFKVAISGAPVTTWELYDTGYTERYMGLPESNAKGYSEGSVVKLAELFPDSPGRLLIIHGLIDENVHFAHTAALISALIRAGKPYTLHVLPNERHAVRSSSLNEHLEATILQFLQTNL